ncbi:hypothetical protein ABFX02_14G075500 [Erythranthe guttata]
MAVNANDVHICLCKILNYSWKTCVAISTAHPFASFSFLCLFVVYISFPSVFWFLIYSFPLVVSTCFILSISSALGDGKKCRDNEREGEEEISDGNSNFASDNSDNNTKKSYTRVHSVRRRRAKELKRDDNNNNNNNNNNKQHHKVEEKNAFITSTNFNLYDNIVDKKPLIEECAKEIRDVEVDDYSLLETTKSSSTSPHRQTLLKEEFRDEKTTKKESLKNEESEEEEEEEEDDKKNVIDIGISEPERNKRLESLIARRRSRKLLSLQVRRTLMDIDKTDRPSQIASIVIPKSNIHSSLSSPFSPGPGSAPSILVPMRNPFDLPYDPQEEKPDLTGDDSFQREFMPPNNITNRDIMFCRHESFTLGAFFPGEYNHNRDFLVHDFGFRQRPSFQGYPRNHFDREFTSIIEQESHERTKSKSTNDNPDDDDDQIKEVIQVYENDIHNHSEEDATCSEVETSMPIPHENSSTVSNSPSSSEENEPVYKIDKEAILKSLSSMARRNVVQEDPVITDNNNNEPTMNHFNYNNCPFDACSSSSSTSTRLKERFYYGDKFTRRHARSFSIASDLQVEVSEVSSPPLTIDENYSYHDQDEDISSYDGDMEKKIPNWDDQEQDLWASSFRLSHLDDNEINEQDMFTKDAFSRINNGKRYCISSSSSTADLQEITGGGGTSLHDKIHEMFQYSSVNPHENKRKNKWNLLAHTLDGYESGTSVAESSNPKRRLGEDNLASDNNTIRSRSQDSEETVNNINDVNIGPIERSESEQSFGEGSSNRTTLGSNDPQPIPLAPNNAGFEHVQASLISPTSVLVPTLSLDQGSLSSFDHDIDDQVSSPPVAQQNSTASVQESSQPSTSSSTTEADDTESLDKQNSIPQNDVKQKEILSGTSQTEESRNNHDVSIEETQTTTNHTDNTNSTRSVEEEELSDHQDMVNVEASGYFSEKSASCLDHKEENSPSNEDTGIENCSNEHMDHERQTASTSSNFSDGTKDDAVQNLDVDENHLALSRLVEGNENSEIYMKNEHDRRAKQHDGSHELMPAAEDKLN